MQDLQIHQKIDDLTGKFARMEKENERRKPLTEEEVEIIKSQLLDSIYADIGKSIVKKFLWIVGVVFATTLTTLTAIGKIKLGG